MRMLRTNYVLVFQFCSAPFLLINSNDARLVFRVVIDVNPMIRSSNTCVLHGYSLGELGRIASWCLRLHIANATGTKATPMSASIKSKALFLF
jgi:hypothetical protein